MKRPLLFPCALCLVIGLLLGVLLPVDWHQRPAPPAPAPFAPEVNGSGQPAQEGGDSSVPAQPQTLDPADNFPLLSAACAVNRLLQRQDYARLSGYVHPTRGVTFTPYSTVNFETDLNFTPDQIKSLAQNQTVYTWGVEDGRGDPIRMTMTQYIDRYVYDKDYCQAPEVGVDRIMTGGNALENLAEEYPGCRFVDFSHPSADPVNDGLDWSSLKLVFAPGSDSWLLVGIVHGEWTI